MKPGSVWLRRPITQEERDESGPTGWACVFALLDGGRMLTITEEGDWAVHGNVDKFAYSELEEL